MRMPVAAAPALPRQLHPPAGLSPTGAWLVRASALDDLFVNIDRNEGNMLIDPAGQLILIHSRTVADGCAPCRSRRAW